MPALQLVCALFAIAMVVWLAFTERRTVRAPMLALLRCLFPAWRFFEAATLKPQLSYRLHDRASASFGPWRQALRDEPRALPLPLNAAGNLALAYQSMVERFEEDLEDESGPPVADAVSYALVDELVRHCIAADGGARGHDFSYQFRLQLVDAGVTDLYLSPLLDSP